jgi:hypothetical protein
MGPTYQLCLCHALHACPFRPALCCTSRACATSNEPRAPSRPLHRPSLSANQSRPHSFPLLLSSLLWKKATLASPSSLSSRASLSRRLSVVAARAPFHVVPPSPAGAAASGASPAKLHATIVGRLRVPFKLPAAAISCSSSTCCSPTTSPTSSTRGPAPHRRLPCSCRTSSWAACLGGFPPTRHPKMVSSLHRRPPDLTPLASVAPGRQELGTSPIFDLGYQPKPKRTGKFQPKAHSGFSLLSWEI